VLFGVLSRRRVYGFAESKADIARATAKKYAFEAYPSWRLAHADTACPRSLEELNDYMNNKDTKDPWGGSYVMGCGEKNLVVMSPGEDGLLGTADDIRSWE